MLQQESGGGGEVVEVVEEPITRLGEVRILKKTVKQQTIRVPLGKGVLLLHWSCSAPGPVPAEHYAPCSPSLPHRQRHHHIRGFAIYTGCGWV